MREVRMTFGEHLEDLRRRILWAILWLAIGVTISFIYGKSLLKWTMGPHEVAIRGAVRDRAASILLTKGKELLALAESGPSAEGSQETVGASVWEQLFAGDALQARISARFRLLLDSWGGTLAPGLSSERREAFIAEFSTALAGSIADESASLGSRSLPARFRLLEEEIRRTAARIGQSSIKRFIGVGKNIPEAIAPLETFNRFLDERRKAVLEGPPVLTRTDGPPSSFIRKLETLYEDMRAQAKILGEDEAKAPIAISYLESFMTYFKVALVFGLFLSIPLILYEMWKFIGAGLYPNEQRYVLIFLPFSVALFFGGALFGYTSVIPVALSFLAGWGSDMVEMSFTLSNYVGLFFTLTVLLGLVFQTPLVMIFLGKIGLVTPASFRKGRKFAILGSVIFAAVVTPPDPFSWTLVAGPMIVLYEVGILLVALAIRPRRSASPPPESGSPTGTPQAAAV